MADKENAAELEILLSYDTLENVATGEDLDKAEK
jgi:hypothetical protein